MTATTSLPIIAGDVDATPIYNRLSALAGSLAEAHAKIVALEAQRSHTPTALNALDYGVVLDNPEYDNGPPLSRLLATCKKPVFLEAGDFYFQTPIVWPVRKGGILQGSGIGAGSPKAEKNHCVSRLIYNAVAVEGKPLPPALKYCGQGGTIDNITIQRGDYPAPKRTDPPTDGSVGLAVTGNMGVAGAKLDVPRVAFIGWDCAIEAIVGPDFGSNNGDTATFGTTICQNNNTFFRNRNPQAKAFSFHELSVHHHTGIVFDCVDCADIYTTRLTLDAPALVCRIGSVSSNNGKVVIEFLGIDNNAKGVRLFEQIKPSTCSFTIRDGCAGNNIKLTDDLVKLYEPLGRYGRTVSITLDQHGVPWKWGAK